MARSLNKVQLIGNLTRAVELRYTPQGTAVCTFGLATNRQWKTENGEAREEVEFHRLVAWDKLAEICAQMLDKGKRAYFEGRIQTRKWTAQDNTEKTVVEIVVSDMIVLENKRADGETSVTAESSEAPAKSKAKKEEKPEQPEEANDQINDEDIPF